MSEPYQRLQENQLDAATAAAALQAPKPTLRYHPTLFKLAVSELVLAILILVFGTGCLGTSAAMGMYREGACSAGTGVWTGILAVVSASFGMAALKRLRNKCLLIAFFILCILSAIATGILFLVSAIHSADGASRLRWRGYMRPEEVVTLVLNILLTLISLGHAICCIVSTSLLCYSWGCTRCCTEANGYHNPNAGPNVVYMPHTGVSEQFGRNQQYILLPMPSNTSGFLHQPGSLVLQARELQPLNPASAPASAAVENQQENA